MDATGLPFSVSIVLSKLHQLADFMHIKKGQLTPHSSRIGMATAVVTLGISDDCIMQMGRWSSEAFRKYIHCQVNAF